jgi:hypothetical protein
VGGGGGTIFRPRPDRPWGTSSHLYNGYTVSFPEVKRPRRGIDHPLQSSAEVKKEHSYTLLRLWVFIARYTVNFPLFICRLTKFPDNPVTDKTVFTVQQCKITPSYFISLKLWVTLTQHTLDNCLRREETTMINIQLILMHYSCITWCKIQNLKFILTGIRTLKHTLRFLRSSNIYPIFKNTIITQFVLRKVFRNKSSTHCDLVFPLSISSTSFSYNSVSATTSPSSHSLYPSFNSVFRRQLLRKMGPIQISSPLFIVCRIFLSSLNLCNAYSFLARSVQIILILFQHNTSKLSSEFWSTFRSVQVSAP